MTERPVIEHYWEPLRYEPEQMPPDDLGRRLWRIRDHHNGAHVEGALDMDGAFGPLEFPSRESAEGWIGRLRHMTEGRARAIGR